MPKAELPAAVAAAIAETKSAVPQDKLERVRDAVKKMRVTEREVADLEGQLKIKRASIYDLQHRELPDLFDEVGTDRIGLPPEGNMPGYDAVLAPYYHANISAEWPEERQAKGFGWLEEAGHGDLLKTLIIVELGRGQRRRAEALEKHLAKKNFSYSRKLGVPWNTLTAWLREQVEKKRKTPPLDLLGATVGRVVKLTPRKD